LWGGDGDMEEGNTPEINIYIYIHIERERERERDSEPHTLRHLKGSY
jgi:hypothetical protein